MLHIMVKDLLQGRTGPNGSEGLASALQHTFKLNSQQIVRTNHERTGRARLLRLHHPASAEVISKQLLSYVDRTTYLHTEPCTDTACKGLYTSYLYYTRVSCLRS